MRALLLVTLGLAAPVSAATQFTFTLNTHDEYGAPLTQSRLYYVYRPTGLSTATPVPLLIIFEGGPDSGAYGMFNTVANQAGFVVVTAAFSGNRTGTPGT